MSAVLVLDLWNQDLAAGRKSVAAGPMQNLLRRFDFRHYIGGSHHPLPNLRGHHLVGVNEGIGIQGTKRLDSKSNPALTVSVSLFSIIRFGKVSLCEGRRHDLASLQKQIL